MRSPFIWVLLSRRREQAEGGDVVPLRLSRPPQVAPGTSRARSSRSDARTIPPARTLFFESIAGLFYKHVFTALKETYRKTTQLGMTFTAGYLAGIVYAVVSRLEDSLVFMGKPANQGDRELGRALFHSGRRAWARGCSALMIGAFTGFQCGCIIRSRRR